jgi:hypothetical protein
MLPGADTAKGKLAYGIAAVLVLAACAWQVTRPGGGTAPRGTPFLVVCDTCGFAEDAREVPLGEKGDLLLPVACKQCGAEAAALAYACPVCRKLLAVDPKQSPAECKHCRADLKGMFTWPAR